MPRNTVGAGRGIGLQAKAPSARQYDVVAMAPAFNASLGYMLTQPQHPVSPTGEGQHGTKQHSRDRGRFPHELALPGAHAEAVISTPSTSVSECELAATMTTLMIRNIPGRYRKRTFAHDVAGPEEWDFLYLPGSCELSSNRNYAFINFTSAADASSFVSRWHKNRLPRYRAQKPLNVCYAAAQGFHANALAVLQNRNGQRCEQPDCYCTPTIRVPALLEVRGEVVSF